MVNEISQLKKMKPAEILYKRLDKIPSENLQLA